MIRSNFAITRLVILPYSILLVLYLTVVGGGGTLMYLQVRAVETRLVMDEIGALVEPFAEKLAAVDPVALMEREEPWLLADVEALFADLPELRNMSLRDHSRGFVMDSAGRRVLTGAMPPLSADAQTGTDVPAAERLHAGSASAFHLRFDLSPAMAPPVRLALAFDRSMLLERIDASLAPLRRTILIFGGVGGASIFIALGITAMAMRATRRIEAHCQELHRRASITQLAAELVHDLRNPLMALRANVKGLLVSPRDRPEIIAEMDRDILAMSHKLNGFLDLTRGHDDTPFEAVDIADLLRDAVRLAEPVLEEHGLAATVDVPARLPAAVVRRHAVRDALVNVIVNAAESGQKGGVIEIEARLRGGALTIAVADRGDGLPEGSLERIFEPFYGLRPRGNGLGLAIVQRIVADHQGTIRAEHRDGGGTRIILTLPLQPEEPPRWWNLSKKTCPT